jgi:hypothetical protein
MFNEKITLRLRVTTMLTSGQRQIHKACLVMATNSPRAIITRPAKELNFQRFVAALRGHVVTFPGSKK